MSALDALTSSSHILHGIFERQKKTQKNNSSAFYNFRQNLCIVQTRQNVYIRSCLPTFILGISAKQEILFSSEQWSVYVIKFRAFQLNNKVAFERINALYLSKE